MTTQRRLLSDDDIEAMREALQEAMTDAIKDAGPTIAAEMKKALQEEFERSIGRGVIGWMKRILLAAIIGVCVYFAQQGYK